MRKAGRWALFFFTIPGGFVFGWLAVGLLLLFRFAHRPKILPYGILSAEWKPWWGGVWKYSTTFGRAVVWHPGIVSSDGTIKHRTYQHEMVHLNQHEDEMIKSFIVGAATAIATFNIWLGLAMWTSGVLWQAPNFLTALLRRGNVYRDSEHERSAYAQTSICSTCQMKKTWLDRQKL